MRSDEFRDSAALYAIGALDPVSARRFEKYLRTASESERREVSDIIETAALLPYSLPELSAPAHLRQLLFVELSRAPSAAVRPASPQTREWPGILLIAATVILTLGCALLIWQNRQLAAERNQLSAQLAHSSAQLAAIQKQWNEVLSPATRVISLSGEAAPQASAKLVWDTRQQQWIIYLSNLPALPADKDYQLWYLTSGQAPISAAVFRTDQQGRGEVRLSVPAAIAAHLAATAVSLEPKGGSPQPTGQIYLKGTI